jgi:hypothetical protein
VSREAGNGSSRQHTGIGSWPRFHQVPVLLLTEDNRSGKSVLMSRISYQLQSQAVELVEKASIGTTTARKPILAYHFFPSKSDKSSKHKEQRPTMTALKCLALQVAEQYSGY